MVLASLCLQERDLISSPIVSLCMPATLFMPIFEKCRVSCMVVVLQRLGKPYDCGSCG